MREILRETLISRIKEMFMDAAVTLPSSVVKLLEQGRAKESSQLGKSILDQILKNEEIAQTEHVPLCQDTGIAVIFLEVGNEVFLNFDLEEAVNEAVRQAYKDGFLRKSVVRHPLDRVNTNDNTPAVIHVRQTLGDKLKISIAPKGAGSENMSRLAMLPPSAGREGIEEFVLETVRLAGGKACPPLILGIGIGGNFEEVALIAKEALFRPVEDKADNPIDRDLEEVLLHKVNELGVGPMGLGGNTTCLAVKVNSHPCHIASLPVAVNIQCHSARKNTFVL